MEYGGEDMEEEYNIIEIPGKHGVINLHVPKREATQEEIDNVYKAVAEIAINNSRKKKPADK